MKAFGYLGKNFLSALQIKGGIIEHGLQRRVGIGVKELLDLLSNRFFLLLFLRQLEEGLAISAAYAAFDHRTCPIF